MEPRDRPEQTDDWPALSDEDRRGIARIRRELDEEYGALDDDEIAAAPAPSQPFAAATPWARSLLVATALIVTIGGGVALLHLPGAPGPSLPSAPPRVGAIPAPSAPSRAVERDPVEDVRGALEAWLDATRQGDIAAQMAFYPRVVPVYYTWRNTPRAAVLAEKRKVFGDARVLDIRIGLPRIEVTRDGTEAVTSFRKAYVIEGPRVHRRGEVLQELRWARTAEGWKITSERDAAVRAGGSSRARAAHSRSPWPRLAGARAAIGAPTAAGGTGCWGRDDARRGTAGSTSGCAPATARSSCAYW